jgi:hypothetical protein
LANAALADADFTTGLSILDRVRRNADEIERTKTRIISSGLGDGVPKNPYLLSRTEEREAAKKQLQLQSGLTVPRRYVHLFVYES